MSKQPKAVVKCYSVDRISAMQHVHNEAIPYKLKGSRWFKHYVASLEHSPSGPVRANFKLPKVATDTHSLPMYASHNWLPWSIICNEH